MTEISPTAFVLDACFGTSRNGVLFKLYRRFAYGGDTSHESRTST